MKKLKILNAYAGLGGNRKLWGDDYEITAVELNPEVAQVYQDYFPNDTVIIGDAHEYILNHYKEFDIIWCSPPCQTHSRARMWGWKNDDRVKKKYPDMKLYQEILFLKYYFNGLWVIENVKPYYDPLITPKIKLGRHLFWSNFNITKTYIKEADINKGNMEDYIKLFGFDLRKYKIKNRKDQIYRNCVHPETGLHILNCALGKIQSNNIKQGNLFA